MHHHAYAYTGHAFRDGQVRAGRAPATFSPIEIRDWLRRPAAHVVGTFTSVDSAVDWLRQEYRAHPPLDLDSFPLEVREGYWRERLSLPYANDVVQGFYSGQQYVSRALMACLDPGEKPHELAAERPPCPYSNS